MANVEVGAPRIDRALSCTSLASQLTNRGVSEPPQIALTILSKSHEILA